LDPTARLVPFTVSVAVAKPEAAVSGSAPS
jgi:hypothetical protein